MSTYFSLFWRLESPRMSSTVSGKGVLFLPYRWRLLAVSMWPFLNAGTWREKEIFPHFLSHQSYQVSIRLHLSLIASKPLSQISLGVWASTCEYVRTVQSTAAVMVFEVLLFIVFLLLYHSLSGKVRIVFTLKKKMLLGSCHDIWQAKIKKARIVSKSLYLC